MAMDLSGARLFIALCQNHYLIGITYEYITYIIFDNSRGDCRISFSIVGHVADTIDRTIGNKKVIEERSLRRKQILINQVDLEHHDSTWI